ncbi:MAG: transposase [Sedimentisphaerales bacterium]|nr:transposase [Sedimentisphaerales bacterium]
MAKNQKYSKEFKLQACKLIIEQGYSYRKAAMELGVTAWWLREFERLPKGLYFLVRLQYAYL